MRFAVQQLLGAAVLDDGAPQVAQRAGEQRPVGVGEGRGAVAVRHEALRLRDPVREVRHRHVERAHAQVQPFQRVGVVGRCDPVRRHGRVVRPQRDHEAVPPEDPRPHPGVGHGDRTARRREPLREVDLEPGDLLRLGRHPGQDVARQQPQRELVRVVQDGRVLDREPARHGGRPGRGHRASSLRGLHARPPPSSWIPLGLLSGPAAPQAVAGAGAGTRAPVRKAAAQSDVAPMPPNV